MTCSAAKTFAVKKEKNIESNVIFIEHAPLCRHSTSDVSSDVMMAKIRPTDKRFLPCAGAAGARDAGIRWPGATKPHILVWRPEAFREWLGVALRRSNPMPKSKSLSASWNRFLIGASFKNNMQIRSGRRPPVLVQVEDKAIIV